MDVIRLIDLYKKIAVIPEIKDAEITAVSQNIDEHSSVSIEVTQCGRDLSSLDLQESRGHIIFQNGQTTAFPATATSRNVVLSRLSPSGNHTAQMIKDKDGEKLMVVGPEGQIFCVNLSTRNLHGKVYCDPYLSCLEWSSDETRLAFVAEKKRPHATSFLDEGNRDNDGKLTQSDGLGKKYEYIEDWGEQLVGQSLGVVVHVDIKEERVIVFDLPDELTPGQLIWVPNTHGIVGVAYPAVPYRIGLAFSSDRESFVFHLDAPGNFSELSPRKRQAKCPRFSHSGKYLIYLTSTTFGPRAPTAKLAMITWSTKEETILIDYVRQKAEICDSKFYYGVCGMTKFPRRCFDSSEKRIIFSSLNLNNFVTYVIEIETGKISALTEGDSSIATDVKDDWIVLIKSTITQPTQVIIGRLPPCGQKQAVSFFSVTKLRTLEELPRHWYEIFPYDSPELDDNDGILQLSALYMGPKAKCDVSDKRPLICRPHGGPHSITINRFQHAFAFLVCAGYSIIFPNYRGSAGHGEDLFTASVGHLGLRDIPDCNIAIQICCERYADVVDPKCLYLTGCSHGGLLSVHLASKYPDTFSAVCTVNAALDLHATAAYSDIPEWAFLEFGLSYTIGRSLDVDSVVHLFQRSPLSVVEKLKAPTLFIIGKEDERAIPHQSRNFYRMLKARNVPTKLLEYDDNHLPLRITTEGDHLIQMVLWFRAYTSPPPL